MIGSHALTAVLVWWMKKDITANVLSVSQDHAATVCHHKHCLHLLSILFLFTLLIQLFKQFHFTIGMLDFNLHVNNSSL